MAEMTNEEIPQAETPPETAENLSKKTRTAVIGFAGFMSGGSNTAQYEAALKTQFGKENVLAFPSVSTKFAFGESGLSPKTYINKEYYKAMAAKAIKRFADHDTFLIHCQSGGGIEGLAFARALLENENFKAKKINFLFTGVPGFAEHQVGGLGRVFEFIGRFFTMGLKRAENQHFDLCPPPEEFYDYQKKKHPAKAIPSEKTETVYYNNPTNRQERREKFYDHYMDFLSSDERTAKTKDLTDLDKSIKATILGNDKEKDRDLKELMKKRAGLVFKIGGDRYYNEYVAHLPEYKNIPDRGLDGKVVGAVYIARVLCSVAKGMEKRLGKVLKLAQKKGVEANFALGVLENDTITKITDIPYIKERFNKAGVLDDLISYLIIEGLSHESIDNSAQGILEALKKLALSLSTQPSLNPQSLSSTA